MVTLPRFLYLFQNLPIYLPKKFLKTLDSIVLPFVWGFKAHRISKIHVCKPRSLGGLGLPNFQHYYWAANCRALTYWQDSPSTDIPPWLLIEQGASNSSLSSLLFANPATFKATVGSHFMIHNSLRIWLQIGKAFKLPNTSFLAPVCRNHAFKPSLLDPVFTGWARKGILTLRDLYIDNNFATFTQLTEKYDLPASHFFRYLQIRNYVRSTVPNSEILSADNELHKLLTCVPNTPKLVTKFQVS